MGKEPGFRQRLFGEFVLAALVVILGAWALTRPGLSPRLWTMVLVVVVIAPWHAGSSSSPTASAIARPKKGDNGHATTCREAPRHCGSPRHRGSRRPSSGFL